MAETFNGWEEEWRITSLDGDVEVEEREEQVYEDDGTTPMTKQHEADPDSVNKTHRTRVKLKRYFYRIRITVGQSRKVVGDITKDFGDKLGDLNNGSGFHIKGDAGVKYLCGHESSREVRPECKLSEQGRTWNGFGPWKKVPHEWGLDQSTEKIEEGDGDGGDAGGEKK